MSYLLTINLIKLIKLPSNTSSHTLDQNKEPNIKLLCAQADIQISHTEKSMHVEKLNSKNFST